MSRRKDIDLSTYAIISHQGGDILASRAGKEK